MLDLEPRPLAPFGLHDAVPTVLCSTGLVIASSDLRMSSALAQGLTSVDLNPETRWREPAYCNRPEHFAAIKSPVLNTPHAHVNVICISYHGAS